MLPSEHVLRDVDGWRETAVLIGADIGRGNLRVVYPDGGYVQLKPRGQASPMWTLLRLHEGASRTSEVRLLWWSEGCGRAAEAAVLVTRADGWEERAGELGLSGALLSAMAVLARLVFWLRERRRTVWWVVAKQARSALVDVNERLDQGASLPEFDADARALWSSAAELALSHSQREWLRKCAQILFDLSRDEQLWLSAPSAAHFGSADAASQAIDELLRSEPGATTLRTVLRRPELGK